MTITVIKPGLFSTIQDSGRYANQQYGVVVSGAMDMLSYRIGQLLLQQENKASIEITMLGPTLRFDVDTVIVITGANFSPLLNEMPCPMWRPIVIKAGSILKCAAATVGARGYIAVKHGIQVPAVLGSRSTYLRAKIGGFHGRALQKGDVLPIAPSSITHCNYFVKPEDFISFSNAVTIRVTTGTEWEVFTKKSQQSFLSTAFQLSKDADRMGYRLQSDSHLTHTLQKDLISEAVTFGTIQIPPSGQPIILMADRQTTGGYPKIAQVIQADLPKLAQLQSMTTIRFIIVSLEEAQEIYMKQQQQLALLKNFL
ncbi:biotin-dependent carboxyltransferase family protein [Metasolibacillus meyeri]|uniref:5-oxoprolinase subunit C family protein n=1 Tax=Metasolibacillus meyeri TaxID=1071052 RepID=UPI000D31E7F2|nr:biotin-dependent carboxyltransferase family protein [Metasolibacillus meyeri]